MKKININREQLNSEEIENKKNFKNVYKDAYKFPKPLYKTPKFLGGVIVILSVLTVLIIENYNKEEIKLDVKYINPPLKSMDIRDSIYQVDATDGDTINHSTGTQIIIPSEAFVDEQGNVVKGQVNINYREFNALVDIFFSGIPMSYDSGATKYQFESAGMCEIKGFQNKKPIFINKQKSLTINMASQNSDSKFNMYYLDTIKKNWEFTGKDSINDLLANKAEKYFTKNKESSKSEIIKLATSYINTKKAVKLTEQTKPIEPRKADVKKESFSIDVDNEEFPEIAIYKDVLFEVWNNKKINKDEAEIEWSNVELKKLNQAGIYQVKFFTENKTATYEVQPVFEGKSYENAKNLFSEKFETYQTVLQEKIAEEKIAEENLKAQIRRQKEEEEKLMNEYAQQRIQDSIEFMKQVSIAKEQEKAFLREQERRQAEYKKRLEEEYKNAALLTKITRTFTVNNFGYVNSDSPKYDNNRLNINAQFSNKEGELLKLNTVCLVDKNSNTIYNFRSYNNLQSISNFQINPKKENIIWAVIDKKYLGIVRKDKLKGDFQADKTYTLEMDLIEINTQTPKELEKTLGI